MTRATRGALLFTALFALARDAGGQEGLRGFWIGAGTGGGWKLKDASGGIAPYVRAGVTLRDRVMVGVEVIALGRRAHGEVVGATNATLIGMVYPHGATFHVRGGVGLAAVRLATLIGGHPLAATERGVGFTAGVGRDWGERRGAAFAANVDVLVQRYSSQTLERTDAYALLTVGVTRK